MYPVEDLEGIAHMVVPVVLITEGVFKGSRGPVLYTKEELARSAESWNGKPVVIYHPSMEHGNGGYAANPRVYSNQKVGTLFHARWHNNALKADAWINCERVRKLDERVWNAIVKRKVMEVSTGLSFPLIPEEGMWEGRAYELVATNIAPDHIAILPDRRGACSVADGAGLCRNNYRKCERPLLAPVWA